MKSKLISLAAYAKLRGVHPSAVTRAVRAGRITLVEGKVDPVAADAQWAANSRARAGSRPSQTAPSAEGMDGGGPDYSAARARREEAEASMAEDRLRQQRGELLVRADLRAVLGPRLAGVRDGILNIPARMAPTLHAAKTIGEVQTMLDSELHAVLGALVGLADSV